MQQFFATAQDWGKNRFFPGFQHTVQMGAEGFGQ
jgi:hypothetical protein